MSLVPCCPSVMFQQSFFFPHITTCPSLQFPLITAPSGQKAVCLLTRDLISIPFVSSLSSSSLLLSSPPPHQGWLSA